MYLICLVSFHLHVISSKRTNKIIIKCYLPRIRTSRRAASVFVPERPASCWWGIYRAATVEPGCPCTCIPAPVGGSLLWHVLATCKEQTCNHEEQFLYFYITFTSRFLQPSCLNVQISISFPGEDLREVWRRGCLRWQGTSATSMWCGHLSLEEVAQRRNQLQFGSTVPTADKFVLLLSKQWRPIRHQTPVAVARVLLAPPKNLR